MEKGTDTELSVGDVFGIPVKNHDDKFYEICRFLVEELSEEQNISSKSGRIVDTHTFIKIGEFDRKRHRSRRQWTETEYVKESNGESRKRIRLANPDNADENAFEQGDINGLCAEINFLRGANEISKWNHSDDLSILRRAQHEVRQARKQLSEWVLKTDIPNEIAINIEALVCGTNLQSSRPFKVKMYLQEREKKEKEAELNQNLLGTTSAKTNNFVADRTQIIGAQTYQMNSIGTAVLKNPEAIPENPAELRATKESLAVTRKRCDDLDRALNQAIKSDFFLVLQKLNSHRCVSGHRRLLKAEEGFRSYFG